MRDSQSDSRSRLVAAALTRAESMRTQISLALSFCDKAEIVIGLGEHDEARSLIRKTRHAAEKLSGHLHEEGYVPENELSNLTAELDRLNARISKLEQRLTSG